MFLAGLVLTVSAVILARNRISAMEIEIRNNSSPVEIVVPSIPISSGEVFSENNLSKKSVPASGTGKRNVPAGEFELLIGNRAKGNLAAGDPVLWTDVEEPFDLEKLSQVIPPGKRALSIEADSASSFAGLIRPGDRVDLLCEQGNGGDPQTWIHAIPVISVDRYFNHFPRKEESSEISTITVSVTPEEGRVISSTIRNGRIYWFLRNPEESVESPIRIVGKQPPIRNSIEIWKGGVRETVASSSTGNPG